MNATANKTRTDYQIALDWVIEEIGRQELEPLTILTRMAEGEYPGGSRN